jgi:Immunoglobulin domain
MCTSTQGDQPFNITWYRDGKALGGGEQTDSTSSFGAHHRHHFDERTIEINTLQSFSSILTIHNITSQHNGNYTCQISNPAGVVDYTVALSVSGKYKWQRGSGGLASTWCLASRYHEYFRTSPTTTSPRTFSLCTLKMFITRP